MLKRVFINPDNLWARVEKTPDCPEGELLYSPISVISDDTHTHVYLAGQTARLPINGEVASDDMRDQIRQTCENIGIGVLLEKIRELFSQTILILISAVKALVI